MRRALLIGSCLVAAVYASACREREDGPTGSAGKSSVDGGSAGKAGARAGGAGGGAGKSSGGTAGRAQGGSPAVAGGGAGGSADTELGGAGAGGDGAVNGGSGTRGGSGGDGGTAESAGAGGQGALCEPTSPPDEVCDGVDNDCNGDVDDIDVGGDGIRDCLEIVLIGAPGANASSNFQTWLGEQGAAVSRIHNATSAPTLTAEDLDGYGVVILDNLVREYSADESEVLGDWVRDGGGLISLNGHTGSADLVRGNSLLVDLGVEHLTPLRSGNVTTFRSHPLTVGLTSVTFSGGYRLGDLPSGEGSTIVAEISDGPVGLALERGSGRAFVWGDEWVEFDSEWQALPEIKTFWVNAFGWVSGAR